MRPFFSTLVILFILTIVAAFVHAIPTPASRIQSSLASVTEQPSSLPLAVPPEPTVPAHLRQAERDDHDGREQDSTTTTNKKTTDSKGKTVIVNVSTVVIVSGDGSQDPNKVYSNSNGQANQQDVSSGSSSVSDPNSGNNVTEQLHQDQAALKRMITILSVVGGVGAIAVVVSVLVFTRMRARKRKALEVEEEELQETGSDSSNHQHNNNSDTTTVDSTPTSRNDQTTMDATTTATAIVPPLTGSPPSPPHMDHPMPIPSAPPVPAPFLGTLNRSTYERRQNVVSIISQTAPAPSAPSAKELDAMIELPSRQAAGFSTSAAAAAAAAAAAGSSRAHHNNHPPPSDQNKPCPHCEQGHHHLHPHRASSTSSIEPPEAPPPAYTPSAPPIYALPPEPIVLHRRHSQG